MKDFSFSWIRCMFCKRHEYVKKRVPIEGSVDLYTLYVECIHCGDRSNGTTVGGKSLAKTITYEYA